MAVGDVKVRANCKREIVLMTGQTANTAVPTAATDGVPAYPSKAVYSVDTGAFYSGEPPDRSELIIYSTAGSGTMVGTFTLWGYNESAGVWIEIPVNGGTAVTPVALAETDTDAIRFRQEFTNLGAYDRLALQLTGVGGTATAFEARLITCRKGGGA